MCGICVEVVSTSWPSRASQAATQPRPSSGDMHCRAVRSVRRTTIGAPSRAAGSPASIRVSSTTLSPQPSCTSGAPGARAASMSATAGNSSRSSSHAHARSSASARLAATQAATASPTWRTLPSASTGWDDALNPGRRECAAMGRTPPRSAMVNTCASHPAGL
jgi:hypothetical protein